MKKNNAKSVEKAKKLFSKQDFPAVLEICRDLLADDLSQAPAKSKAVLYELIGTTYQRLSDMDKATSYIAEAHRNDPDNKNIHLKLIAYCSNSNYSSKIQPIIRDALSKYGSDIATLVVCSAVYLRSPSLYLAAEHLIRKANRLHLNGKQRNDILNLTIMLHAKKINKPSCIKAIDQLLKSKEINQEYLTSAIGHLINFGENERALELIRDNSDMLDHIILRQYEGACLHELGYQSESIIAYKGLIELVLEGEKVPVIPKSEKPVAEALKLTLKRIKNALNELEIPFFLVAGTALGAVRDGDFLKNEKDLDLAIPNSVPRVQLIASLKSYGFGTKFEEQVRAGVTGEWCIPFGDLQTGVSTDIFFARSDNDKIKLGIDYTPPLTWEFSKFQLTEINFHGEPYLVPDPVSQYLEEFYGPEWKTPQHYCAVLRSNALSAGSRPGANSYGYQRVITLMLEQSFDKAIAYLDQMKLVIEDELLDQLTEKIEVMRLEKNA